jgi:hypothetical protein
MRNLRPAHSYVNNYDINKSESDRICRIVVSAFIGGYEAASDDITSWLREKEYLAEAEAIAAELKAHT